MAIKIITEQNLKELHDYLSNLNKPEYNSNLHFSLPLSAILKDAPQLSDAAQETLADVIASGHGHDNHAADAETMLDLAEKYPILLGRAYQFGGNSTIHNDNVYTNINRALRNRTFEQNIPAIYTLLHYSDVRDTGTGEIGKTSAKNTRYLNEIFRLSQEDSRTPLHANAEYFIHTLPTYQLLNFETKEPGFREYIDQQNFGRYDYNDNRIDMLDRMNPDMISEKTLSVILQSMTLGRPQQKDTANAKTQAEKNANILPMYYTKVRDALLRLAEKQEIHDRNNYGALKTLSRRYTELVEKLLGKKLYNQRGLIQDTYLITLQRDVIDGNAEKLSREELQYVLNNDKDALYVRKIDQKLLKQLKLELPPKQRAAIVTRDNYNWENVKDIIRDKNISSKDKRHILDNLEKSAAADAPQRDALNAELAKYDQDYQIVASTGRNYTNVSSALYVIQEIQKAYENVRRNFNKGTPSERESSLAAATIENTIYDYISRTSQTPVAIPAQGSLPIFGRSKEKDRREHLAYAINKLNDTLSQIANKMDSDVLKILSKYKGNILNPETRNYVIRMQNEAYATANKTHAEFMKTHREPFKIKLDLEPLNRKQGALVDAQSEFKAQQTRMHNLSKRLMGYDQTGELVAVTDNMTPEEKRAARQKNRDMLKNKLTERKNKKPAHNLKELLQNADIDR